MGEHLGFKSFVSACIVAGTVFCGIRAFDFAGLPFVETAIGDHTLTIAPFPGETLPAPLVAGDEIDVAASGRAAREAAFASNLLPLGATYHFMVVRPHGEIDVPLTVERYAHVSVQGLLNVSATVAYKTLLSIIALLLLWRGHDRAAWGLFTWAAGYFVGALALQFEFDGMPTVVLHVLGNLATTVARVGFYVMAESLVATVLSASLLRASRWIFALVFIPASIIYIGRPLIVVADGWSALFQPLYTFPYSFIYFIPLALLAWGLLRARALGKPRLQLRWMLACGALFALGITIENANLPSTILNLSATAAYTMGIGGMCYALLRHRVIDLSIVIDRALVYGLVTTLVVGVLAAVNSLALKAALPAGAGLLLQIVVPLSIGIVLGKVRNYMDRVVERVFFRKKFLAEKALRTFARHAGHIDDAGTLLGSTLAEIHRRLGTPAVAVYAVESGGFRRLESIGDASFPEELGANDPAVVALKADHRAVDLDAFASVLGPDGCVFPMLVLGNLRGFIVCQNRPGEHFGTDEKRLLTFVAREVGAAWRILRARENEAYVVAMANGTVPLESAREKARALTLAWSGA